MKKVDENNVSYYVLLDNIVVDVIITLLLLIGLIWSRIDLSLGFLLGSVISIINYLLIIYQSNLVVKSSPDSKVRGLVIFFYLLRFILYALGLFLALFLAKNNINIFAWYTVFAAYMITQIIIYTKYSRYNKKIKQIDNPKN